MLVVVEGQTRHPVVDVKGKRVRGIVDKQHFVEIPIGEHPQILDIHPLFGLHAVLAEQPVLHYAALGVHVIQHHVRIA